MYVWVCEAGGRVGKAGVPSRVHSLESEAEDDATQEHCRHGHDALEDQQCHPRQPVPGSAPTAYPAPKDHQEAPKEALPRGDARRLAVGACYKFLKGQWTSILTV